MKKSLLMSLSAACLLAACSNNSDETQQREQQVSIDATACLAGAANTPMSRAAIDALPTNADVLNVAFARLDQTAKDTYPADYTRVTAAAPASIDKDGKVTFNPEIFYLTNKEIDKTKLVGWFPAGSLSNGSVSIAIDGATDVMLSNEKEGSLTQKFGTNDFTFDHCLAQFVVKAYAADATSAGATGKWGKITKMEFTGQPNQCTIALPTTVTTSGSASITLKASGVDTDMAEVTLAQSDVAAAATCGYAILAPTSNSKVVKLKVTTSTGIEQEVDVTLSAATEYEKSKIYTVVLKFSTSGITPAGTTISQWTAASENPGDITM